MLMTKESISTWLEKPETLPKIEQVAAAVGAWPWFTPVRLMEAVHASTNEGLGPRALNLITMFGPDLVTAQHLIDNIGTGTSGRNRRTEIHTITLADPARTTKSGRYSKRINPLASGSTSEILPDQSAEYGPDSETEAVPEPSVTDYTPQDYFSGENMEELPPLSELPVEHPTPKEDPNTLMVMRSFTEWLDYFKTKNEHDKEEERGKSALRSMWQQEKLAAAMADDVDEIPEDVFEMAVNSITREEDIISEPLARILEKQEKWQAAAEMYKRLSLQIPSKSSYFASRAEAAKKRLQ